MALKIDSEFKKWPIFAISDSKKAYFTSYNGNMKRSCLFRNLHYLPLIQLLERGCSLKKPGLHTQKLLSLHSWLGPQSSRNNKIFNRKKQYFSRWKFTIFIVFVEAAFSINNKKWIADTRTKIGFQNEWFGNFWKCKKYEWNQSFPKHFFFLYCD